MGQVRVIRGGLQGGGKDKETSPELDSLPFLVVALGYNQICSQILSLNLFLNFGSLNNILCPYKQKGKAQENIY